MTPWWYPLLMAGFMTSMPGGPVLIRHGYGILGFGVQIFGIAALIAFVMWYRSRWGAWPRTSAAPPEIKRAYLWYLTTFVAGTIFCGGVWLVGDRPLGLAAIFVGTYALSWVYERVVYPRAAQRVRERLA